MEELKQKFLEAYAAWAATRPPEFYERNYTLSPQARARAEAWRQYVEARDALHYAQLEKVRRTVPPVGTRQ